MNGRRRRFFLIAGVAGAGGGVPPIPAIALQFVDGEWVVDDANVDPPDGYFVVVGDELVIDDAVGSGLPIAVTNGEILVGTP